MEDEDWNNAMLDLAEEEAEMYELAYQTKRPIVINARQPDATTCPSCRATVPLGQFCGCPARWKG